MVALRNLPGARMSVTGGRESWCSAIPVARSPKTPVAVVETEHDCMSYPCTSSCSQEALGVGTSPRKMELLCSVGILNEVGAAQGRNLLFHSEMCVYISLSIHCIYPASCMS